MNKGIKRVLVATVGVAIISSNMTTVMASGMNSQLQFPIVNAVEIQTQGNKMNSNKLYIIEKDVYKEILKENTAVIENKNNLLIINSENITKEEMEIIKSSITFYIFGELKENLSNLEDLQNYGGQLNEEDKYEMSLKIANHELDKDIIIANGESMADYFIATQLGSIEDRNVLLIKDELDEKTEKYLKINGKEKSILFLEGHHEISTNVKEEIMKVSGEEKYELDQSQLIKEVQKELDIAEINKTIMKIKGEDNKVNDNKGEEIIADKLNDVSNEVVQKSKENTDELLYNKNKVVSYKEESVKNNSHEAKSLEDSIDKPNEEKINFVETLKFDENPQLKVIDNKEIESQEENLVYEGYSLKLTYADPINLYSQVSDNKTEYTVPKETTDYIVNSVMEGDYGNGEEREQRLTKEGYDYREIQSKIDEVTRQRRSAYEQTLAQEYQNRASSYELKTIPQRNSGSVQINNSSVSIETFINKALTMQGWTYSQDKRWEHGYADCSSIVIRAMIDSGITQNTSNLTTHTISSDPRFYEVSMSNIQRGDILWYSGHMEIYMGDNTTFGAFRPGKVAGYASNINRFNRAFRISGE